ncbi:uncharacterized protein LOC134694531 [Mytilus trossulus]|uniref:uncharacterized protein LOC134694531 n=1 Tax=Mytilus trossulus TaxID=6551 RepID=UPI00300612C1
MIQCYAPTNDADETKITFYEKLQSITCKTPRHDILIVLGDMNAKVGNNNLDRERVMGKYGLGTINENGELLVDFCGDNDLVIGVKLKQPALLKKFKIELRNRFQVLENLQDNKPSTVESLEQGWSRIETVFKETSRNTLGLRQRERKKWMSDETWTSIQQRKDIKTKLNSTKSERIQTTLRKEYPVRDKEVKRKTKADKAIYLETLAKEAETAASKGELSTVYKITKELRGKHMSSSVPCKSKDGKTLASERQQLQRWTEHFKETLNAEHQADVPVIGQFGMELDIDIGEVSRDAIRKAILRLKNGKSPGLDATTAEMLKADIKTSTTMFHELFKHIWRHDTISNDWAKGLIIKLLKKGDQSDCNNWRGITLLSVPSKILLRVLLNRKDDAIDEILRKEQAGNRNNLQNKTTRLNETAQSKGLTISEKKTKLMNISSNTIQPVYLGHNIIEEVEDFTYLGSMLSNTNGTAKDLRARISKAKYPFCPYGREGQSV